MKMKRRSFMVSTLAGAIGTAASTRPLPQRLFRDDIRLSIIGFGGMALVRGYMGQSLVEQSEADRLVAEFVDHGVNYFDVAPRYGDGEAETKLGPALKPFRNKVFLACKTQVRTAVGAREELERSLRRLETDHFDLYQFHGISKVDQVDQILAPGGAAEMFLKAREEGKIRYLGFSAHSVAAALSLLDRFKVDSILFPVNYVCYERGNFGPQILQRAKEKGVARLALKALCHTKGRTKGTFYEPIRDEALARQALRFTLGEDVTAALPPGNVGLHRLVLKLAAEVKPLSAKERQDLLASAAGLDPLFTA